MRCEQCNKFVSYDEPECEVNSVDLSGDMVTASVTVNLNCAECSQQLKTAEIEAENQVEHECLPEDKRPEGQKGDESYVEGEDQYEVEDEGDAEGTSRTETKDRNGKPIKSSRYMKTFYGFSMEVNIICRKCGESVSVSLEGEEQASAFDEC